MDDNTELAPHIEDIAKVLGDKADFDQIEKELRTYLDTYRLPLGMAKNMLVKKFGGDEGALAVGVAKTLAELQPNEQSVEILARIVAVNPKDIEVEGKPKSIFYGIMGDHTGTVPFTAWEVGEWKLDVRSWKLYHSTNTVKM